MEIVGLKKCCLMSPLNPVRCIKDIYDIRQTTGTLEIIGPSQKSAALDWMMIIFLAYIMSCIAAEFKSLTGTGSSAKLTHLRHIGDVRYLWGDKLPVVVEP